MHHPWGKARAALSFGLIGVVALGMSTGCATKGFVKSEAAASKAYADSLDRERMQETNENIAAVRRRADEAWEKASLAERLASGTIQYDVVSTGNVHFAFDDWALDDEGHASLDAMVREFASRPRGAFEIRGFADATGTDRYNYRLGRERAESVQRYLMARHEIPANRIAIVSFGEEAPVADNDSYDGRAQNRRAQVRLLDLRIEAGDPLAAKE